MNGEAFRAAAVRVRGVLAGRSPQRRAWLEAEGEIRVRDWAVFGCCDAAYVPRLLVALLSVRKHHPEIDAFLFCQGADPAHVRTARRLGIDVVDEDPSEAFRGLQAEGSWPRQCFAHLVAWRLLLAKGYRRSFSIDGDVLCCRPLPLGGLESDPCEIACVCNGSIGKHIRVEKCSGEALEEFSRRWAWHWGRAANTGIVFWNHSALEARDFAEKIVRLEGWNGGGLWMPSDQHLLALALAVEPLTVRWLDTRWNFTRGQETGRGRLAFGPPRFLPDSRVGDLSSVFFLHFFKPWELLAGGGMNAETEEAARLLRQGLALWQSLAKDAFGESWGDLLRCPQTAVECGRDVSKPSRMAWGLALAAYPLVGMICQAGREGRRVLDFFRGRPVRDLSPSVLAIFIPFLRPWPMILRAVGRKTAGENAEVER